MTENPTNKFAPENDPASSTRKALSALANHKALTGIHKVSAFNLAVGVSALGHGAGGELIIKLPTKSGDVAEVTYRGLEGRR